MVAGLARPARHEWGHAPSMDRDIKAYRSIRARQQTLVATMYRVTLTSKPNAITFSPTNGTIGIGLCDDTGFRHHTGRVGVPHQKANHPRRESRIAQTAVLRAGLTDQPQNTAQGNKTRCFPRLSLTLWDGLSVSDELMMRRFRAYLAGHLEMRHPDLRHFGAMMGLDHDPAIQRPRHSGCRPVLQSEG